MQHNYFVYITTNPDKTVLYSGATNDLKRRLFSILKIKERIRHLQVNIIAII